MFNSTNFYNQSSAGISNANKNVAGAFNKSLIARASGEGSITEAHQDIFTSLSARTELSNGALKFALQQGKEDLKASQASLDAFVKSAA